MTLNIRQAERADIIHFLRLGRRFADFADEPFDRESATQHMEWLIDSDNTVAFMAIDIEGAVLGICGGVHIPTLWDRSKLMATELWWYVDPDSRNAGVGTALMNALESWARSAGAYRMEMMTLVDVGPSVGAMYERNGYRERERGYVKEL